MHDRGQSGQDMRRRNSVNKTRRVDRYARNSSKNFARRRVAFTIFGCRLAILSSRALNRRQWPRRIQVDSVAVGRMSTGVSEFALQSGTRRAAARSPAVRPARGDVRIEKEEPTRVEPGRGFLDLSMSWESGGGGSRTRVRKYVLEGIYMRIRFFFLMPHVRKRLKTVGHQPRSISRFDAEAPSNHQPV